MSKAYIPSRDVDVVAWALNFSTVLAVSYATYGLIVGDAAEITGAYTDLKTAFDLAGTVDRVAVNPGARTAATVADLAAKKAAFIAVARSYAAPIIRNPSISDADKTLIGVTVSDGIKTVIPPPSTAPFMTIAIPSTGIHRVETRDTMTPGKKAKPFGVIGNQIFGATSATVVTDPTSLPFLEFGTRTFAEIEHDAANKGKRMYYATRWQNAKGETGPWSEIVSSIIA